MIEQKEDIVLNAVFVLGFVSHVRIHLIIDGHLSRFHVLAVVMQQQDCAYYEIWNME